MYEGTVGMVSLQPLDLLANKKGRLKKSGHSHNRKSGDRVRELRHLGYCKDRHGGDPNRLVDEGKAETHEE